MSHKRVSANTFAARASGGVELALELVRAFLTASFTSEARHARRLAKINELEKNFAASEVSERQDNGV